MNFPFHFRSIRQMKPNTGTRRFLSFCYSLMGKGNVQTRPFIYTAETIFSFIAHHNNLLARAIFTATLSSTVRLTITRYTIFHPSTSNNPLHPRLPITRYTIFHPSSTNNPLHYLYFSTCDYQIATCVTYMQSLPL